MKIKKVIITIIICIISLCACQKSQENLEFVIPASLLGGKTAQDSLSSYLSGEEFVTTEEGEVPIKEFIKEMYANEDGTVTYIFSSEEMLDAYKEMVYEAAKLNQIEESMAANVMYRSIHRVEYEDDIPSKANVYIDQDNLTTMVAAFAELYPATYMGLYQVLSGTDPDEWHVDLTFIDEASGEVAFTRSLPEDWYENTEAVNEEMDVEE